MDLEFEGSMSYDYCLHLCLMYVRSQRSLVDAGAFFMPGHLVLSISQQLHHGLFILQSVQTSQLLCNQSLESSQCPL